MNLWENAVETKNRKFLVKSELGVNCYAIKCDQHVHALIIISNNISDNDCIKGPWFEIISVITVLKVPGLESVPNGHSVRHLVVLWMKAKYLDECVLFEVTWLAMTKYKFING